MIYFLKPGSPSQVGSKPGDAKYATNSLWPLGAAWVRIPLPAPSNFDIIILTPSCFHRFLKLELFSSTKNLLLLKN